MISERKTVALFTCFTFASLKLLVKTSNLTMLQDDWNHHLTPRSPHIYERTTCREFFFLEASGVPNRHIYESTWIFVVPCSDSIGSSWNVRFRAPYDSQRFLHWNLLSKKSQRVSFFEMTPRRFPGTRRYFWSSLFSPEAPHGDPQDCPDGADEIGCPAMPELFGVKKVGYCWRIIFHQVG